MTDGALRPQSPEYQSFLTGETRSWHTDIASIGPVRIQADPALCCYVEWGGWHWQASAADRAEAVRRLRARLNFLDPFYGEADWGEPGYKIGELDVSISQRVRDWMEQFDQARTLHKNV